MVIFTDASRFNDHGELVYLSGLLFGKLSNDSVFHAIPWYSHKSRRPTKSITSAKTLATGEAIDEGKVLANVFNTAIGLGIELSTAVHLKDLFDTFTTCILATDRSKSYLNLADCL